MQHEPAVSQPRLFVFFTRALFGALFLWVASGSAWAGLLPRSCDTLQIAVSLAPGEPADQRVSATLCRPLIGNPGQVDLLVHGATYNGSYWDFPALDRRYSYVDRTLLAGRAVLFFDRIGTGQSSRPASDRVSVTAGAYVMHQLVQWLRARGYRQVNAIGHSLGSITTIQEASTYGDVDRVVLTGLLHKFSAAGQAALGSSIHPAVDDPQFAALGLDAGYLTTVPGTRRALFYSALVEDAVVQADEAHKDLLTQAELNDAFALILTPPDAPNVSTRITAPVLLVVGTDDILFCDTAARDCASAAAIKSAEAPFYPNAKSLTAAVVPGTGHDLPLHLTTDLSFGIVDLWLRTH